VADVRTERDSMGEMTVPAAAYYGAQTARAVENFPISGLRFSGRFVAALGLVKASAARVNAELGLLEPERAGVIITAAEEVVAGKFDAEFVVDVFQTGSGTSTNMNANEVIAQHPERKQSLRTVSLRAGRSNPLVMGRLLRRPAASSQ